MAQVTVIWVLGLCLVGVAISAGLYFLNPHRLRLRQAERLWQRGERDAAHDLLITMVPRLKNEMRYRELATVRLMLAAFFWERGLPKAMADHARRAIDESVAGGRDWQRVIAETAFGIALVEQGRWDEARKPLEAAELASMAQGLPRVRMFVRTGLGWVHLGAGNRQMATDYARAACTEVRDHPQWAFEHPILCLLLGQLCYEMGLWDDALARLDEAQAHAILKGQAPVRARALLLHGQIDRERGHYERAAELFDEALRVAGKEQSDLMGRIQLERARLFQMVGETGDARLSLEQARMAGAQDSTAELGYQIALALAAQFRLNRRFADARELLLRTQVELLSEEPGPALAQTLVAWGELFLDQGEDREAYAHFRLAERLFNATGKSYWDIDLPYRLALLHHRMGLLDQGIRYEKEGDLVRRKLGVQRQPALMKAPPR